MGAEFNFGAAVIGAKWRTNTELVLTVYPDEIWLFDVASEEVAFRQTIPNLWAIALHPNGSITVLTEDYHLLMLNPT